MFGIKDEKKFWQMWRKFTLIMLIIILILSILIILKGQNVPENPFIEYVNKNCYNNDTILKQEFIEGNRYLVMKSKLKDTKWECAVFDGTSQEAKVSNTYGINISKELINGNY